MVNEKQADLASLTRNFADQINLKHKNAAAQRDNLARIIAAADAYCAMTTDRVYSKAKTPEDAVAELRRSAGTHLDPQVVRALLDATGALDTPRSAGPLRAFGGSGQRATA